MEVVVGEGVRLSSRLLAPSLSPVLITHRVPLRLSRRPLYPQDPNPA